MKTSRNTSCYLFVLELTDLEAEIAALEAEQERRANDGVPSDAARAVPSDDAV